MINSGLSSSSSHHAEVLQYCNGIKSKKILSGIYTQKAIKRFLDDVKRGKEDPAFPYVLIPELADEVINFAAKLKIPDQDGKPLKLLPWHKFIYYNLYAFVCKADNTVRRFRQSYVEVARKNSKTTSLLFPTILYDYKNTPAAESFFVSKDLNQSVKTYRELTNLYLDTFNINIRDEVITEGYGIRNKKTNSFLQFFSSDARAVDGYKNSFSCIDEYHAYDSDKIVTAFSYGGRARKNNTVLVITSAGTNISGPCYAENLKAKKILNGVMAEDSYFCIIYAYDDGDDWQDPKNFIKANPSLHEIIKPEILENDLKNALLVPHRQSEFKAKTCGIWASGKSNWIPLVKWDTDTRNKNVDISEFEGMPCYCGLDLSLRGDISAYTKCFEKDGRYYFYHRFYVPSETLEERYLHENISFKEWAETGIVTATPGATIDYDYIVKDILEDAKLYDVREIAIDEWKSKYIIEKLEDGIPDTVIIPYRQGIKQMSGPSQMCEKLIIDDSIVDPNPCQKWMVTNAIIKPDANGNIKVMKESHSSTARIDGVITAIMSLDRCMANQGNAGDEADAAWQTDQLFTMYNY